MAVGPIPSSAISAWIKDNGITHAASLFRDAIRAMDRVYLDHVAQGDKADRIVDEPFRPGMLTGKD